MNFSTQFGPFTLTYHEPPIEDAALVVALSGRGLRGVYHRRAENLLLLRHYPDPTWLQNTLGHA